MSEPIKIGIVGLDSSHCVEYARLLHDEQHSHHISGGRIVAGFPGGSPDWDLSISRVRGYCDQLKNDWGVPIVDSIEEVVKRSDALMILSVDGRRHCDQFEAVAPSGKPVYIDKPLSVTTADAGRLAALAKGTQTRVFSSSVWRFSRGLDEALAGLNGSCRHAHFHGQWPLHEGLHGWLYYGIHQVEMLYAAMGTGCRKVSCHREGEAEMMTGFWPEGRVGSIATNHAEQRPFGGWLLGEDESTTLVEVKDGKYDRYRAFLQALLAFYRGREAPVPLRETLETIAFFEAAALSVERGGGAVDVSTYLS